MPAPTADKRADTTKAKSVLVLDVVTIVQEKWPYYPGENSSVESKERDYCEIFGCRIFLVLNCGTSLSALAYFQKEVP
eukprot:10258559-Ditylum_brightwellii.AAC.1